VCALSCDFDDAEINLAEEPDESDPRAALKKRLAALKAARVSDFGGGGVVCEGPTGLAVLVWLWRQILFVWFCVVSTHATVQDGAREANHQQSVEEDRLSKLPKNYESKKRRAEWVLENEARKKVRWANNNRRSAQPQPRRLASKPISSTAHTGLGG
jgi:hypothetical protein